MKSAQRIAGSIDTHIVADQLTAGDRIGSEADLIAKYEISRTVFREAVRILEHDGIASMRRGPGGGLFVTAPDPAVVTNAAALWLRHEHSSVDDVFDAREMVEARCATLAADSIDSDGIEQLRFILDRETISAQQRDYKTYVQRSREFHGLVARLSGNPVCELIVTVLAEMSPVYTATPNYPRRQLQNEISGHQAIAEAVIGGDGPVASRLMIEHLRDRREFAVSTARRGRTRPAR